MAIQISGTTVIDNSRNVVNVNSVTATTNLDLPDGTSAQRPGSPSTGSIRWNIDLNALEIYDGTEWKQVQPGGGVVNISSVRGVFGGANITIDYITIATTGNATDFGDLTVGRSPLAACSSSTRGVFGGGGMPFPSTTTFNTIDYITIATTGNATDFGDLTLGRNSLAACSSSTRGVFGGGRIGFNNIFNTIDYITIATTGNATDFGDLTQAVYGLAACSDGIRGVFGGGTIGPTAVNIIDYITIAAAGGKTYDFGDLTVSRSSLAACSSSTRGVFGGSGNTIDYITIATTGNATDFGDLTRSSTSGLAACSSSTRGVFGGGGFPSNTIDYITIATTGNATDFGDLTVGRSGLAACSDGHGGLFQ